MCHLEFLDTMLSLGPCFFSILLVLRYKERLFCHKKKEDNLIFIFQLVAQVCN